MFADFDQIKVGETRSLNRTITEADVRRFVEMTGDDNPLHIDRDFAEETSFKDIVVHGMLGASFISTVIGTQLPGPGALWVSQSLDFLLPVRDVRVDGHRVDWSRPNRHELRVQAPVGAGTRYEVAVRYGGLPARRSWDGERNWLADDTEVQPDLIVAARTQFTRKELPGPPLLAVEVLSPSTRRVDLLLKRDRLQAAGVPSYWLADPEHGTVTVLELRDGVYAEVAHVEGESACEVSQPFRVRLVPADLLEG